MNFYDVLLGKSFSGGGGDGGHNPVLEELLSGDIVTLETYAPKIGHYPLQNLQSLTTVDLKALTGVYIEQSAFRNDSALSALIIRSETLVPLTAVGVFLGTPFYSNGTGGTLYVPEALIDEYKNETNWSYILSHPNNKIQAIEGSEYE